MHTVYQATHTVVLSGNGRHVPDLRGTAQNTGDKGALRKTDKVAAFLCCSMTHRSDELASSEIM